MSRESDFLVWGSNQHNLLSQHPTKYFNQPTPLHLPYGIVSICASEKHVSFVTEDGDLYSYGSNADGRLGVSAKIVRETGCLDPVKVQLPGRVTRVESGFSHMVATVDSGILLAWGLGEYGALGTGEFKTCSLPTKVKLSSKIISNLKQISCGAMHTGFLTEDGRLYLCGSNEYGELGFPRPDKVPSPSELHFPASIRQVSCGVFYTLILTHDGLVYGIGNNKYGQLGTGNKINVNQPTLIKELEGIVKVTAGYHSGAIDRYGNLYLWGSGSFGEFLRPKRYVLSVPVKDIAIRGFFGLAIGENSKGITQVYAWGNNSHGELANSTCEASKEPTQIQSLRGVEIGKITLGVNFSIMMLNEQNNRYARSTKKVSSFTQRSKSPIDRSYNPSERKNVSNFEENYRNSYLRSNIQKSVSPLKNVTIEHPSYHAHREDYKKQFFNLSEDYEILLKKYSRLEKQLHRTKDFTGFETDNLIMKQEIEGLKKQLGHSNSELKKALIRITEVDMERKKNQNQIQSSRDLEAQYSRLLNEKEKIISKLNQANNKTEQQFKLQLRKIKEEQVKNEQRLKNEIQQKHLQLSERNQDQKELKKQLQKFNKMNDNLEKNLSVLKQKYLKSEDEKEKYVILNSEMAEALSETERVNELAKQYKMKYEIMEEKYNRLEMQNIGIQQRAGKLQVQLNYQLQFNKKCNDSLLQLEQINEKLHKSVNEKVQIADNERKKIEELQVQIQKGKKYKKQMDLKNIQLEQFQQKFEGLKKKSDQLLKQKENQIAETQDTLARKKKQFDIKLDQKVSELNQVHQQNKNLQKEVHSLKDKISISKHQIDLLRDQNEIAIQQKAAIEKKFSFINEELNRQINQRQSILKDFSEAKREVSRLNVVRGQLETNIDLQRQEKEKIIRKLEKKQKETEQLKEQFDKLKQKCENLMKENELNKEALRDTNFENQQLEKLNKELEEANRDFAQNQNQLNGKIESLQKKIYQLQDENKSYTPRYEALMLRNRQLDERNRQLGQMVNKAIQVQAQSYKNNILKQVQVSTNKLINSAKAEQNFNIKQKRKLSEIKKETEEKEEDASIIQTQKSVKIQKQEPYTKLMKDRIHQHKRRVSQSAHKLANILDMEQNNEGRGFSTTRKGLEEYEQINSQMESFSNQKSKFMSKINSFAQKLKIL